MRKGRLNVVIDLQWGSTGKGKLCHWLALKEGVDVATCDFQTNAGHTVVEEDGRKFVFQQLPVSARWPGAQLLINPGATISIPKLLEEVETHGVSDRLLIHPHAAVVTEEAVKWEKENLKRISSTLKGVGATLGMKTMRAPGVVLAKDAPELKPWIGDTTLALHTFLKSGASCLAEAAQGFDLSLNHGHTYPYVTSRDITTASVLSNAGVPPQLVGDVYGCLRTHPIRVGHQYEADGRKVGDSGPIYEDHTELTWEELEAASGSKVPLLERTTVTQKVRRIFTFSKRQLVRALRVCAPTHLFLNFINHVDASDMGKRSWSELSGRSREFVRWVDEMCEMENGFLGWPSPRVSHVGTGAGILEMMVL
jgi:adenylosuccinate synthase